MKNLFLTLIGIGGLGTIGTTTYNIFSETDKSIKRNLNNEKHDLNKEFGNLFQKTNEKITKFSIDNPIIEKIDDPKKSGFVLKILKEIWNRLLKNDISESESLKKILIKTLDENKKHEVEEIYNEIKQFTEKFKINKDNLEINYEEKFNF